MSSESNFIDLFHSNPDPLVYTLRQDQGQLFLETKPEKDGTYKRLPEKDTELYVRNIPRFICIQYLYEFFGNMGEIFMIRFFTEYSGYGRGYCYITYYTNLEAKKAICNLNNTEVYPNFPVSLCMSYDNKSLLLEGIPDVYSYERVGKELSMIFTYHKLTKIPFEKTGVCDYLMEFESHVVATQTRKDNWPLIFLFDDEYHLDWAYPENIVQSVKVNFEYLDGDLSSWNVIAILSKIIDVGIILDISKYTTYGWAIFKTEELAKNALPKMAAQFKGSTWVLDPNYKINQWKKCALIMQRNKQAAEEKKKSNGICRVNVDTNISDNHYYNKYRRDDFKKPYEYGRNKTAPVPSTSKHPTQVKSPVRMANATSSLNKKGGYTLGDAIEAAKGAKAVPNNNNNGSKIMKFNKPEATKAGKAVLQNNKNGPKIDYSNKIEVQRATKNEQHCKEFVSVDFATDSDNWDSGSSSSGDTDITQIPSKQAKTPVQRTDVYFPKVPIRSKDEINAITSVQLKADASHNPADFEDDETTTIKMEEDFDGCSVADLTELTDDEEIISIHSSSPETDEPFSANEAAASLFNAIVPSRRESAPVNNGTVPFKPPVLTPFRQNIHNSNLPNNIVAQLVPNRTRLTNMANPYLNNPYHNHPNTAVPFNNQHFEPAQSPTVFTQTRRFHCGFIMPVGGNVITTVGPPKDSEPLPNNTNMRVPPGFGQDFMNFRPVPLYNFCDREDFMLMHPNDALRAIPQHREFVQSLEAFNRGKTVFYFI